MNKLNKKSAATAFAVMTLLVVSLYSANMVFAEDVSGYPPIVQRIADKFNLNIADVDNVFKEERSEMWERGKQNLNERLSQAVKDGKISEDQKNKILEKRDEMAAERSSERQQHKDEMQEWMKENGIDPEVLSSYMFGNGGHGRGGFNKMMFKQN